MRILHFADTHARDRDIAEIEKCLNHIVQVATDEEPDLIVMAGDTFDSRMVRLDSQAAKLIFGVYSELADVAPMVVITGTNSHDGLTVQVMEYVQAKYPIHVADYPEQIALVRGMFVPANTVTDPDAIISLIPTPTKQYWERFGGEGKSAQETDADVANAMGVMLADFGASASGFGCPHIAVAHLTVRGCAISDTQVMVGQDIELGKDQLGLLNADLVCLGHIHYPQKIEPNIFYSGSIYAKDFGEAHRHGFYVHHLADTGPAGLRLNVSEFFETPTRKLIQLKTDLTNGGRPVEAMMAAGEYDIAGAFVRLEIKAWQDEADTLDLTAIRAVLAAAQDVDIRLQRVPRETVRCTKLLELQTLRDKIWEMGMLRKEEVPETILAKADMLETMPPEELYKAVGVAA